MFLKSSWLAQFHAKIFKFCLETDYHTVHYGIDLYKLCTVVAFQRDCFHLDFVPKFQMLVNWLADIFFTKVKLIHFKNCVWQIMNKLSSCIVVRFNGIKITIYRTYMYNSCLIILHSLNTYTCSYILYSHKPPGKRFWGKCLTWAHSKVQWFLNTVQYYMSYDL